VLIVLAAQVTTIAEAENEIRVFRVINHFEAAAV
jgi:hypothetical protein